MTRILLWYWGRRGGGAQYALSLARALAPEGLVLSLSRQNSIIAKFRELDVPRQEIQTYGGKASFFASSVQLPWLAARLQRFAQEQGAVCVLSAMTHPWTSVIAPLVARRGLAYVPVVHDAAPHPGDTAFMFDWRLDRELRFARAAVVLSDAVAERIARRRPGLPLIRLQLGAHLPHGVADARPRWDFLFFGRVRAYKGLDLLRDAWSILCSQYPGATLRVIGEGDVEAHAPGLKDLPGVTVEQRWVADADMAAEIASARVLMMPYREASQSGVLPIALAHGIPVIATTVGGLREQFIDGQSGLAVSPEPHSIADAMRRVLCPDLLKTLSDGAREQSASVLDWDRNAASLRASLSRVLNLNM